MAASLVPCWNCFGFESAVILERIEVMLRITCQNRSNKSPSAAPTTTTPSLAATQSSSTIIINTIKEHITITISSKKKIREKDFFFLKQYKRYYMPRLTVQTFIRNQWGLRLKIWTEFSLKNNLISQLLNCYC